MPVLTAVDVLGVQRFVFASNRLRDAVTGSWLVHWGTTTDGALEKLVKRSQVLMAGGGNVVLEFDDPGDARAFAAAYTRRLHDEAPGLETAIAHREFERGKLARALQEIQLELARVKTERIPAAPQLGLSVTAPCRETGLPAAGFAAGDQAAPLALSILKRRGRESPANGRWNEFLVKARQDVFAFPLELDRLGRSFGDTSLIGIVHLDGNGVGEKIGKWLEERVENGADDGSVRREYRDWSGGIDSLGREVFARVLEKVIGKIVINDKSAVMTGKPDRLEFELARVDGRWQLPLRPVLLGGDDLTFICDGRIALALADAALSAFEKHPDIPPLGKIGACAGVAVVRVHSPFSRAADLAEQLCRSAKRMVKEKKITDECALDWHFGLGRPGETVTARREEQYQAGNYCLTGRPYRMGNSAGDQETWRWLAGTLLDNQATGLRGATWSGRRGKVKSLPALAREGPDAIKKTFAAWKVVYGKQGLGLPGEIETGNGFFGDRTALLDAVELLDLHLALD